jgi:hypothetical protein
MARCRNRKRPKSKAPLTIEFDGPVAKAVTCILSDVAGEYTMDVWWKVAEYGDYRARSGPGDWDSGVLTVSLEHWDGFNAAITQLLDLGDFVWRGQRQNWSLKSRFQREVQNDRAANLQKHTRAFERAIKGRRGVNPPPLNDDFCPVVPWPALRPADPTVGLDRLPVCSSLLRIL